MKVEGTDIYVRNLHPSVKDADLEEFFSEFAPVTRCFVVKSREQNRSRGYGFVSFADPMDASSCCTKLQGREIKGRRIRLELALDRSTKVDPIVMLNRGAQHCVAVSGLKEGDNLDHMFTISGMAEEVVRETIFPVPDATPGICLLFVGSKSTAKRMQKNLDNLGFCGRKLKARVVGPKIKDNSRVIMRNIPFNVTREHLLAKVSESGVLLSLDLPRDREGHLRGLAFGQCITPEEAEALVQALNGTTLLGRMVSVDLALGKEEYQKRRAEQKQEEKETKKESTGDEKEGKGEPEEESEDGAEGKEEEEEAKEPEEEEKPGAIKPAQARADDSHADLARSVFVTSLPPRCGSRDLKASFGEFGEITRVRIVRATNSAFVEYSDASERDAALRRYRETARRGQRGAAADVAGGAGGRSGAGRSSTRLGSVVGQYAERPEAAAAVARAAAAAAGDGDTNPFILGGQEVVVMRPQEKRELEEKKDRLQKRRDDPRNARLLREGLVQRRSDAAEGVSDYDLDRRDALYKARLKKLKDVDSIVSETRVCIRNVPKGRCNEKDLRELVREALGAEKLSRRRLLQAKAVTDSETGKARGYAFLQFARHSDALKTLQALNNNPDTFSETRRPILEFAVESRKKLIQLERTREAGRRNTRIKAVQKELAGAQGGSAPQEEPQQDGAERGGRKRGRRGAATGKDGVEGEAAAAEETEEGRKRKARRYGQMYSQKNRPGGQGGAPKGKRPKGGRSRVPKAPGAKRQRKS